MVDEVENYEAISCKPSRLDDCLDAFNTLVGFEGALCLFLHKSSYNSSHYEMVATSCDHEQADIDAIEELE